MEQCSPLLWSPSDAQKETSLSAAFCRFLKQHHTDAPTEFRSLYAWSIENPEDFWSSVWDFCGVIGEKGQRILINPDSMLHATFFPEAKLNYAENLLRKEGNETALYFKGETNAPTRTYTYDEVRETVRRLAIALKNNGVVAGDRIAAFMPNIPETVMAMLAATSLGAVWCSCSPDFGTSGVLDRFGQIDPKILFVVDGYHYNGKTFSILEKVTEIQAQLPTVKKTILFPFLETPTKLPEGIVLANDFAAKAEDQTPLTFQRLPFNHPLFIMFTSGTTGKPKCIVHGAGGTLLQHLKEHQLHCDVKPGDKVFYFTTCGWMMWNWQVSALASQASLVLFDGSPMSPTPDILFDYADEVGITLFGVSAKYIEGLHKANKSPKQTHSLASMRLITSTGSPLAPESFDYVYDHIKQDVCLASISGGTDIVSCFVLGAYALPVYRGEIQTRGLGMNVQVFDETGHPCVGTKGELVATAPFPCMPIGFWNDPDQQKYKDAYFSRFPNVWCHGDFIEMTKTGGLIIHGRSDAVLNPGGVRIGTGEIYRQVEQIPEVLESLVIGQDWEGDVRVILFVKLASGLVLDDALKDRLKKHIRANASPRHVPAKIIQVPDIPRTKSGKIVELTVRKIVHNQPVANVDALANPEALAYFENLQELAS